MTKEFAHKELQKVKGKKVIALADDFEEINSYSFEKSNIEQIIISKGIKTIGCYVFYKCKYLTQVTLQEGIERIGGGCFSETPIREIVIPKSVKTLGNKTFCDC